MKQKTLAIIKPDAVKAKNIGNIIHYIENENFQILAIKKIQLLKKQAEAFYKVHSSQPFFQELVEFMISDPIVALCLQHENAVSHWRNVIGNTDPEKASTNSIRKLYGISKGENAVHGSDSIENANIEIAFFFSQLEILNN